MTDNELFNLLVPEFVAQYALRIPGITVLVKQNYQPTQQGAKSGPVAYLHKLFDSRRGHVQRKDVFDPAGDEGRGTFVHTESQWYETHFQLSGLVPQSPLTPNSLTASDVLNVGADIIQSDRAMGVLRAYGVGVLRVGSIRNTPFQDDADRNEFAPSFDFVLTHKRSYANGVPIVTTVEYNFARV